MTPTLGESDETMRCPKCNKIAIDLIYTDDNKTGKKVCKPCKTKILKTRSRKCKK